MLLWPASAHVGESVRTEVTWSEVALQDGSPCLLQSSLALAAHFVLWGHMGQTCSPSDDLEEAIQAY